MNAGQRKRICQIKDDLEELQAEIEAIKEEEEVKFDNLPDNFQGGEQGEKMQECINTLEEVADYVGSAVISMEEIS